MSESIWNDIDEKLKVDLLAYMGFGSAFTTLTLQSVETTILTDPQGWTSKADEMPFAVIESRVSVPGESEHQSLFIANVVESYRYVIACVGMGSKQEAVATAKILDARARRFILAQMNTLPALNDSFGNGVKSVSSSRATVSIYPVIGQNNQYYGFSMRTFDVTVHMKG